MSAARTGSSTRLVSTALVVLAAVLIGTLPAAGLQEDPEAPSVRMARPTWDTGWFQAEVYRLLLNRIGYRVDGPVTMDNDEFYAAAASGDVDLWANGWFPLHQQHMTEGVEAVGVQVASGALQGYFVDLPTATEHGITNLGDLADPAMAALFDVDGNGRADLIGCNLGWSCAPIIDHHLEAYDLGDTVEHVQADYSPLMEDALNRYRSGEPILFYTWTPNWTMGSLVPGVDTAWLETPFPALPDAYAEDENRTTVAGIPGCSSEPCETGWAPNDIRAVASSAFLEANPSVRRLLEVVEIPLADIQAQNARMVDGEGDVPDIERHAEEWISANQVLVEEWAASADPNAVPVLGDSATGPGATGGTLRVAVRTFEPFVTYNDRAYGGFSIELVELISARMGLEPEVYGVNTVAKQIDDVSRGAADIAISGISITAQRELGVDFSLPVFDTGLTIMVPTEENQGLVARLGRLAGAIFSSDLPLFVLVFAFVLLLSAHVIWWLERRHNPDFPEVYGKGIWDSFWWAVVTITTVGYGDKAPKGVGGRWFALLWMIAGYFVFASFTASITSTLAIEELRGDINSPEDLADKKVATVSGTVAESYLESRGLGPVTFDEIEDAYAALTDGTVNAIVFDAAVLQFYASHSGAGEVRTVGQVFDQVRYGIAIGPDAQRREDINLALLELIESGVYDQLHDKWFGALDG